MLPAIEFAVTIGAESRLHLEFAANRHLAAWSAPAQIILNFQQGGLDHLVQTQVLGLLVRSNIVENQRHSGAVTQVRGALLAILRLSKPQASITLNLLFFFSESQGELAGDWDWKIPIECATEVADPHPYFCAMRIVGLGFG